MAFGYSLWICDRVSFLFFFINNFFGCLEQNTKSVQVSLKWTLWTRKYLPRNFDAIFHLLLSIIRLIYQLMSQILKIIRWSTVQSSKQIERNVKKDSSEERGRRELYLDHNTTLAEFWKTRIIERPVDIVLVLNRLGCFIYAIEPSFHLLYFLIFFAYWFFPPHRRSLSFSFASQIEDISYSLNILWCWTYI